MRSIWWLPTCPPLGSAMSWRLVLVVVSIAVAPSPSIAGSLPAAWRQHCRRHLIAMLGLVAGMPSTVGACGMPRIAMIEQGSDTEAP